MPPQVAEPCPCSACGHIGSSITENEKGFLPPWKWSSLLSPAGCPLGSGVTATDRKRDLPSEGDTPAPRRVKAPPAPGPLSSCYSAVHVAFEGAGAMG